MSSRSDVSSVRFSILWSEIARSYYIRPDLRTSAIRKRTGVCVMAAGERRRAHNFLGSGALGRRLKSIRKTLHLASIRSPDSDPIIAPGSPEMRNALLPLQCPCLSKDQSMRYLRLKKDRKCTSCAFVSSAHPPARVPERFVVRSWTHLPNSKNYDTDHDHHGKIPHSIVRAF